MIATGCSTREAQKIVNGIFASAKQALKRREDVDLGFGVLRVVAVPQRKRRWLNPLTGRIGWTYTSRFKVVFEVKHRRGDEFE